jgi:hypothetical protein
MAEPQLMDEFQTAWHRFHPGPHPVTHRLREATGLNMTKFHLLPGRHITATTSGELRDLLERFNRVATATLGEGAPCYLMTLRSPNENRASRALMQRFVRRFGLQAGWQFYSVADKLVYTVWWGEVTWKSNGFNRLLLHIYRQDVFGVLLMNRDTGALFCPYDSGANVAAPTPQALIGLISQFYGWMPEETGFIHFNPAQMQGVKFEVTPSCAAAINRVIKR